MADNRLEPLVLSEDERRTLENWVKRRRTAQGLALRARIVLACSEGASNLAVAARLGVHRHTVGTWRARFLRDRLDGLPDEPRPGVPRTITDAQVEEVVVRTLEEVPEGSAHWSKRELARRAGISPTSVHRIWRAFGLQPRRTETFKISPDPLLIDKIRDVAGLYLAPPANAVVFSVDEKPHIQTLERTAPVLPMIPGVPERRSFDYVRHGAIDLFAALNIATGKVTGKLSAQHRAVDFRDFLDQIDCQADGKDEPNGLPPPELQRICDDLLEASVPDRFKNASTALAADWTDLETFSRPPPHDASPGDCADPEASWGHRTVNLPGPEGELFFGYYLSAAVTTRDENGPRVPELARRATCPPAATTRSARSPPS